jgi:hypothetical protein
LATLAEARAVAHADRRTARQGGDPMQAVRDAVAILTFEEAARKGA